MKKNKTRLLHLLFLFYSFVFYPDAPAHKAQEPSKSVNHGGFLTKSNYINREKKEIKKHINILSDEIKKLSQSLREHKEIIFKKINSLEITEKNELSKKEVFQALKPLEERLNGINSQVREHFSKSQSKEQSHLAKLHTLEKQLKELQKNVEGHQDIIGKLSHQTMLKKDFTTSFDAINHKIKELSEKHNQLAKMLHQNAEKNILYAEQAKVDHTTQKLFNEIKQLQDIVAQNKKELLNRTNSIETKQEKKEFRDEIHQILKSFDHKIQILQSEFKHQYDQKKQPNAVSQAPNNHFESTLKELQKTVRDDHELLLKQANKLHTLDSQALLKDKVNGLFKEVNQKIAAIDKKQHHTWDAIKKYIDAVYKKTNVRNQLVVTNLVDKKLSSFESEMKANVDLKLSSTQERIEQQVNSKLKHLEEHIYNLQKKLDSQNKQEAQKQQPSPEEANDKKEVSEMIKKAVRKHMHLSKELLEEKKERSEQRRKKLSKLLDALDD